MTTYRRKYKEPQSFILTQEQVISYLNWNNEQSGTHMIFDFLDKKNQKIQIKIPAIPFTIKDLMFKSMKNFPPF